MWAAVNTTPSEEGTRKFTIKQKGETLTYADVLGLWDTSHEFRSYYLDILSASPFTAYRWEHPCVETSTTSRPYEFVLVRSESLERAVDSNAFSSHFDSESEVTTFSNLGRDAVMVVPCPVAELEIYGHLAAFVRGAPASQRHELLRSITRAMNERISDAPVWLSTAGMGVSWLHVRLDNRPKYYSHEAYRECDYKLADEGL